MRRIPETLTTGTALLLVTACATRSVPHPADLGRGEDSITVEVTNENYYDVNVFAVYEGSTRKRLGLVTGNSNHTFRFEWEPQQVHFEIDLISIGSFLSDPVQVSPGDELGLRILANLHRSDFWRRKP